METYLTVTGIIFHVVVGGILALAAFFYWCARHARHQKMDPKDKNLDIEVIQMGAEAGEEPTVVTPRT